MGGKEAFYPSLPPPAQLFWVKLPVFPYWGSDRAAPWVETAEVAESAAGEEAGAPQAASSAAVIVSSFV